AEIVSHPGPLGGGEVRVSFTDRTKTPKQRVTMLMRRSWALGSWRVIEMSVQDQPELPNGLGLELRLVGIVSGWLYAGRATRRRTPRCTGHGPRHRLGWVTVTERPVPVTCLFGGSEGVVWRGADVSTTPEVAWCGVAGQVGDRPLARSAGGRT